MPPPLQLASQGVLRQDFTTTCLAETLEPHSSEPPYFPTVLSGPGEVHAFACSIITVALTAMGGLGSTVIDSVYKSRFRANNFEGFGIFFLKA